MKRVSLWTVFTVVMLVASMTAISCSKEKTQDKGVPPGHEKTLKQYLKKVEEAKKTVVARVNGADITLYDLSGKMRQLLSNYMRSGRQVTPEVERKMSEHALDILIFRDLAVQEAARRKMKVPSEKIDEAVQQIKTRAGSQAEYQTYLERQGLTEASLRKEIEKDQLFDMIAAEEIFNKVRPDPKQVREIYAKEKKNLVMPEAFEVADVFFPGGRGDGAAMKKAEEILSSLKKNNNDFSRLPKDTTFTVREDSVRRQEYPALFAALTKMKRGDVSDIITEADGLHIVRMKKKDSPRPMTFEEARSVIENSLKASLVEKRKEEWEKDLKKHAKIEVLRPNKEKK
jgi:parvulin-like peptidyl-prolyl isomerase